MTDWNAVSAFMANVVAWPVSVQDPGYINLHYSMVDKKNPSGKKIVTGWPTRTVDELVQKCAWSMSTNYIKDLWFCTSRQSMAGRNSKGNPKAMRGTQFATHQKSIWIDVDVEPNNPKKYATVQEALAAILLFAETVGLPTPSAFLFSGSGIHVYWISKEPLTPAEWAPYASGLKSLLLANAVKCDAGLTTDIARILRVPGTLNHKTVPPKPVQLSPAPLRLYDFADKLAFLKDFATPISLPAALTQPSVFAEGVSAASFGKPNPAFAGLNDAANLQGGIGPESKLLKAEPILKQCGFMKHALMTEGKDYDNPLWNLSVLCATFMENGNAIAHAISKGHASYSEADTQALYDRKMAERQDRGLGYPSCSTIQGNGCASCATCPLLAKGKSPLNIRPAVTATVNPSEERSRKAEPPFSDPHAAAGAQGEPNPVARLMALQEEGADIEVLRDAMNDAFAVTKYGGQIMIACLFGSDISFMTVEDFHRMFANLVKGAIKVSRHWFDWIGRRQYLGRGVVFEPGGPLEIPKDMLNLWRGFGVTPNPGNWALLRSHMFNVVCSGNQQHFDYLIRLLAYRVQHLGKQTGVAVALLGAPGAGKGVLARTFGHFFGKHFAHITHGDQLTGRFNAALGTASTVFLDEALWAGDKRGEGVLKALITEPQFQLEAKFRDPIMVKNVLFIMVASNNEWAIPAGMGDRRWFVLDVANTYAGVGHQAYFAPLYAEIENGGAAAMLHDLLNMDLKAFDVRAIPHTAAKAKQQALSLNGPLAWLYDVLQEGSISSEQWQNGGLIVDKGHAYMCYVEFSKRQREWKSETISVWSKKIRAALGLHINSTRPTKGNTRVRSFQFAPLDDCRRQFASYLRAPDLAWETENQQNNQSQEAAEGTRD